MKVAVLASAAPVPSVTVRSLTVSDPGVSSSTIVAEADAVPRVAATGADRASEKVSSFSLVVSPLMATATGFEVWPRVKVSVPLAAV